MRRALESVAIMAEWFFLSAVASLIAIAAAYGLASR